jgi:pimeloyl-ACP methyl ester carboxylesterase
MIHFPRVNILFAQWVKLTAGFAALALCAAVRAAEPGETVSDWNGYRRLDFRVAGRPALLVQPRTPAPGRPWIWRAEFFGAFPQLDLALLARGWSVAYMDAKDMYGSPKAIALFDAYYAHVTARYGLSRRAVLEGFSRGGLYAFNYAADHPDRVSALYLDAPALDIHSWPGRNRASKEWRECLQCYGLTEKTAAGFRGSPVDRVGPVVQAGIPIICVCGGADSIVSMAENTSVLEKRYREQGGTIEVIVKPGGGHHPHSLKDPRPIVDFLLKNARS